MITIKNNLNTFFFYSADPSVIIGADGQLKKINPAFNKTFQNGNFKPPGLYLYEYFHGEHKRSFEIQLKKAQHGKKSFSYDAQFINAAGEIRWIQWNIIPHSRKKQFYAAGRDITLLKQQEEQLRVSYTAMEAAANGIYLMNKDKVITWVNSSFSKISGYPREEIAGKTPKVLSSGVHSEEFFRSIMDTLNSGMVWTGEVVNRKPDGMLYTVEQTVAPVYDPHGELSYFVAIMLDISERKKSEKILQDHLALLHRDIDLAGKVQASLLPVSLPKLEGFDISALAIPAQYVSGDLYDCFLQDDKTCFIAMADISGKGFPAAMLASSLKTLIQSGAEPYKKPSQFLKEINKKLYRQLSNAEKFVTLCAAVFNPENSRTPLCQRRTHAGYCCTLALATFYLYWRYRFSLNLNALWFAIPLILAETYTYFDSILFALMMWKPATREQPEPLESATVDIFITTYNEPPELVALTMKAAQKILWKDKNIYVLDDGNSPEIKTLADKFNCRLITRGEDWTGKPRHAKAGNLNNALLQTSGDFILMLDADQIPSPLIVKKIIGFFRDEKVAFVQTPQHFYNTPPGDPFGTDAQLFYGPILKGKDGWNSTFFCGSNALLRREALLQLGLIEYSETMVQRAKKTVSAMQHEISRYRPENSLEKSFILIVKKTLQEAAMMLKNGQPVAKVFNKIKCEIQKTEFAEKNPGADLPGLSAERIASLELTRQDEAIPILPFATFSVTEDMATSIRLHSLGWRSIFYHEILAQGLSPEDLGSTLSQRLRWAQGTIQVLLKENPLTVKGLSFVQRLQYFTTIYSYFSGFANLIFILSPLVFLITRIAPVSVYSAEFLWRLLPFLLLNRLMFKYISHGTNVRRGEQYSLALFPVWIKAVVSILLGRKTQFVVTPKERQSGRFLKLIKVQIFCILFSCAASAYAIILSISGTAYAPVGLAINLFWAAYNALNLGVIVRAAVYSLPKGWDPHPDLKLLNEE